MRWGRLPSRIAAITIAGILLPCAPSSRSQASQPGPRYRLALPSLAEQGESFSGMVVAETDSGTTPLGEGDQVVVSGKPIPVKSDGSVEIPAFDGKTGNVFVVAEIVHATAAGLVNRYRVAEHVEIVPIKAAVPSKVAWTSAIVPGGGTIRVVGARLKALTEAALERADGSRVALPTSVGSSLERFYPLPVGEDLSGTAYRFVGRDTEGRRYEAPNLTHVPRITVSGTPILNRGQRGTITIAIQSGVPVTVELHGGLPQIDLKEHVVDIPANANRTVDFVARVLGQYHLVARIVSPEDPVVATDATRVDTKADPPAVRYDPRRDITSVTSRFRVVDKRGRPVRRASVDVALSHPKGIEFARVATDSRGRANVVSELAGRVALAEVSAHLYRVLGWSWKEPPTGTPVLIEEECDVSAQWHRGPPINVTRELSYAPSDPQVLSRMRPGDLIGLSVFAEDDDILVQECACHGDVDIRRHPPTPDMVRYSWTLDGPGGLLIPAGATSTANSVLYQVPLCLENPSQLRPARITVRITGDVKAADEPIERSIVFQPSIETTPGPRGTQIQDVAMAVRAGPLAPSPAAEPLGDKPGTMCVFDTPIWTPGDRLRGTPPGGGLLTEAGPLDGWPDSLLVVRADYRDSDDLLIKCKSDACTPASQTMPSIYDDVRYDWSFTRGGGEFAFDDRGPAVIIRRPFLKPGNLQVRVSDSGRQGRDTPPVTRSRAIPVRKKPLALVAVGDDDNGSVNRDRLKEAAKAAAKKYAAAGYEPDYVDRLTFDKMQQVIQDPRYQAIFILAHGREGDFLTAEEPPLAIGPGAITNWSLAKWTCPKQPFVRQLILASCQTGQAQWPASFFSLQELVVADRNLIAGPGICDFPGELARIFTPLPPRIPW